MKALDPVDSEHIANRIYLIRGHKVMLDSDLAQLYGVGTGALNRGVLRNRTRFPADFMFQLTADETRALRCQLGTLKLGRGRHRKYRPFVFTEHGSVMLAAVLRSPVAVGASIRIARAFVSLRTLMRGNRELATRLDGIERRLADHDTTIGQHADELRAVLEAIRQLMEPTPVDESKPAFKFPVTGFRRKGE